EHRVDVIQAKSGGAVAANPAGGSEAETLLEDVLVLAAGTTTTRSEDKSIQVRTVTLALTPEHVDKVVAARTKGSLSLALRGVNDHDPIAKPKASKPAAEVAAAPPKVETRAVLVAARDLKPGEPLRPDLVRLRDLPKVAVPPGAVAAPR